MVKLKILRPIIIISILIFCVAGCNSKAANVTIKESPMSWHVTSIPTETGGNSFDYRFNQYFVLDSLTGFIIGNNLGAEVYNSVEQNRPLDKNNYRTVLLKTENGGRDFVKSTIGKGTLLKMVNDNQNNLYVLKETSSAVKEYSILKSTDKGKTWHNITDFKEQKVKNIQFYNASIGIASISVNSSKKQLLKTIDGGKTWHELAIKKQGVNFFSIIFLNENELYTYYDNQGIKETISINFTTGKTKMYECNLPKNYSFRGFFKDNITENLYSRVYNYDEIHELMLFNHTTKKLHTYNFKNKRDEDIVGVNVSGKFISVLRNDKGKVYYYYSKDNGKNWVKESLPDSLADSNPIALYGKGLVWVKSIKNLYNLQVRKPNF